MEKIVRVHRLHSDGRADIILVRESACSGDCHKCSGCGAQKETMIVTAENPIQASVGDFVVVTSDTASVMKAVLAVYLIPLVLFFAGFGAGMAMEWKPGLLGALGFLLGVAYAIWFDRHTAKHNDTVYTITGYAPGQGQA